MQQYLRTTLLQYWNIPLRNVTSRLSQHSCKIAAILQ